MPAVHEFIYTQNLEEHIKSKKEKYFIIKQYLEKYKFPVPIIDSYSGKQIEETVDLEIEKAIEIKSKVKEMIRL